MFCTQCNEDLPENLFAWKKTGVKRHTTCRACKKIQQSRWYQANKDNHKKNVIEGNKRIRASNQERIVEHLQQNPCIDCGYNDVRALQFDHVRDDKRLAISEMVARYYSWSTIWDEIQKCDVRCANCHQIKTGKQLGWWKSLDK